MKTIISTQYLKKSLENISKLKVVNIIIDSKKILFIDGVSPDNNIEIILSNTIGISDTFFPNLNIRIWEDLYNTLVQYYPNDEPITMEIYHDNISNINIHIPIILR